ncbi:hypothetical protein [Mesorhizobium sp. M0028]|uniref:hypothetical protein n=1 Tax=unclassified Mesorhizobium TaxID=325217 RepID=UPI003337C10B
MKKRKEEFSLFQTRVSAPANLSSAKPAIFGDAGPETGCLKRFDLAANFHEMKLLKMHSFRRINIFHGIFQNYSAE